MIDCDRVDHLSRGPFPEGIGAELLEDLPRLGSLLVGKENEQRLAAARREGAEISADMAEPREAPKARRAL